MDKSALQATLFILPTQSLMYCSWERDLKEHHKNVRLLLRKSVPRESTRFLVFRSSGRSWALRAARTVVSSEVGKSQI